MSVVQYVLISLIGIGINHFLSEHYRKNNSKMQFIAYVIIACAFGHQHYSILFEKVVVDNWLFFFTSNAATVSDTLRFLSFIFLVLTTATLPPSKLSGLFKRLAIRT
ncbi:hypothetical protein AB4407_11840 [Vibrio sp. 10N.261.46.E11]|uniref:hypothetical protein n=1 Tax=Vibrio sp. 10N.261.46.E11 TaxID=3229662 RepID=UPI00355396EC